MDGSPEVAKSRDGREICVNSDWGIVSLLEQRQMSLFDVSAELAEDVSQITATTEVFPSLLDRPLDEVAKALAGLDWDFAEADTGHTGHSLQPYPAKFPPQIPEAMIRYLSHPGDLVFDCFAGCGTTAVEALRHNRRAYSLDANPVASLLTRIKTSSIYEKTYADLAALTSRIRELSDDELVQIGKCAWRPDIPNIDRWYEPHVVDELAALRSIVDGWQFGSEAADLASATLAYVATRMSFQASETRYKSTPRSVRSGEAAQRFVREVDRMVTVLRARGELRGTSIVVNGDARDIDNYPAANSVGLVITSPPYPNAYDYHLYQRFRIYWLKQDPNELRKVEIGSHLRNQITKEPIFEYERNMAKVMANVFHVLQPGRFAVFVVGNGLHRGDIYETHVTLNRLAAALGFENCVTLRRNLPKTRRSVTVAGRRLTEESIIVLRKPGPKLEGGRLPPSYSLYPYEEILAVSELNALRCSAKTSTRLREAAFSYVVEDGGSVIPTMQAIAEYDGGATTRKNSTYAGHGLHRYKGKFYPQLAKALINITGAYDRPGVVFDPFGGSGTVAVEARLSGLSSVSIDNNPLAVEIAKAKVNLLDISVGALAGGIEAVMQRVSPTSQSVVWEVFEDSCREEIESWFPRRSLIKISHLLAAILLSPKLRDEKIRQILRVVVSDLIREVSHQDPKDLRVRRRAEPLFDAPVLELFRSQAERLLERRRNFQFRLDLGSSLGEAYIVHGDAASSDSYNIVDKLGGVASVVSSPPYGVALPYLDTDRLSLAAVFGWDKAKRAELEQSTIGSREISKRVKNEWESRLAEPAALRLPASTISFLTNLHEAVRLDSAAGFRRQQTPAVLLRYFTSVAEVIRQVVQRMSPGSKMALILGDSRIVVSGMQWTIPTVNEVLSIAKHEGLDLVEDIPITVTRENFKNSANAITDNRIIILEA
jgi:DNA modification methylase